MKVSCKKILWGIALYNQWWESAEGSINQTMESTQTEPIKSLGLPSDLGSIIETRKKDILNKQTYWGYFNEAYVQGLYKQKKIDGKTWGFFINITVSEAKPVLIFRALAKGKKAEAPDEDLLKTRPASDEELEKFYMSMLGNLEVPHKEVRAKIFTLLRKIYLSDDDDLVKKQISLLPSIEADIFAMDFSLRHIFEQTTRPALSAGILEDIRTQLEDYFSKHEEPFRKKLDKGNGNTLIRQRNKELSKVVLQIYRLLVNSFLKRYQDSAADLQKKKDKDTTGLLDALWSQYYQNVGESLKTAAATLNDPDFVIGLEAYDYVYLLVEAGLRDVVAEIMGIAARVGKAGADPDVRDFFVNSLMPYNRKGELQQSEPK